MKYRCFTTKRGGNVTKRGAQTRRKVAEDVVKLGEVCREGTEEGMRIVRPYRPMSTNNDTFQLKERCRKGVPDSLREKVWLKLSGADRLMAENEGVFVVRICPFHLGKE